VVLSVAGSVVEPSNECGERAVGPGHRWRDQGCVEINGLAWRSGTELGKQSINETGSHFCHSAPTRESVPHTVCGSAGTQSRGRGGS
jgi:hypothetical protein